MQSSIDMITNSHPTHYSYAEYLALEESSNVKHEFLDGRIYAMAGWTPEQAALGAAAAGLLFSQLRRGRCRAFGSSLRIRTASGLATYPDLTFICGATESDEIDPEAVTNPLLIVEVQNCSTEEYDAGEKFEHYKTLRSLRQYVLVSDREHSIVVWTRDDDGVWKAATVGEGAIAELTSIDARLDVRDLYATAAEPSH